MGRIFPHSVGNQNSSKFFPIYKYSKNNLTEQFSIRARQPHLKLNAGKPYVRFMIDSAASYINLICLHRIEWKCNFYRITFMASAMRAITQITHEKPKTHPNYSFQLYNPEFLWKFIFWVVPHSYLYYIVRISTNHIILFSTSSTTLF